MPKIQYQEKNDCYITSIPKHIIKLLGAKKGDTMHYNILENGKAEIIIIKTEEEK
jgi:hypothetical protein